MVDFCPISLCNTFYKILSKILVNHIKPVLDKIISPSQKGFVLGHHTLDAIITTHELLHSMDRCNYVGTALKLDISKAYDKVIWDFVPKVLTKFGFDHSVTNLIIECVTTIKYFVLVNGSPFGFFFAGRGIRQGDPFSPYLFIIITDVLSRNFNNLLSKGSIKGIKATSSLEPTVIQQFVDDTFLFGKAFVVEARKCKNCLNNYIACSGQCINYNKSMIYFFNNTLNLQAQVTAILGFLNGSLPLVYLGLPLTIKEVTPNFWNSILERIQRKLAGWIGSLLSHDGKLQLLSIVLQGIPIYFLSIFKIPK